MVAIYLALILAWPCYQGFRFLMPLLPFLFVYLLRGLEALQQKKQPAFMFLALLLLLSIPGALGQLRGAEDNENGPYGATAREMFAAVQANTLETDRVDFFKPRVMAFLGQRQSHYLQKERIGGPHYGTPDSVVTMGQHPELGTPVWSNQRFALYKLDPNP